MNDRKTKTTWMVQIAMLTAIVLILAFTPLGYIRTGGLEITLIVIPVAVGAVILGPVGGMILGAVFGITSFIQCFGMSPFGAMLLSISPVKTFITCVVTRTLMGFLTGLIYKGMKKVSKNKSLNTVVANLCCPFMNTLFFMTCIVVFFYNTEYIQGIVSALGAANPLLFVLAFVGVNGLVEALLCFVVGSAITRALMAALKNV
ncbi:MAG: ECF transporter S component [bacterium]|nr:ECF transporter S component [bacterium]MDY4100883.1 ECF transporter S component [Lachnospiraceae bacterium]